MVNGAMHKAISENAGKLVFCDWWPVIQHRLSAQFLHV